MARGGTGEGTTGAGAQRRPSPSSAFAGLRTAGDLRVAVAAVHLLLVALIGFAHQTQPVPGREAAVVATVLPDGSVADLCLRPGSGAPAGAHGAALCDACLLTAAPGLPPSSAPLPDVPTASLAAAVPPATVVLPAIAVLAFRGRGPPVLRLVVA